MTLQEEYSTSLTEKLLGSDEENPRLWLTEALEKVANSSDPENELLSLSARARRGLGDKPLGEAGDSIETPHGPLEIGYWSRGDAARTVLLLHLVLKLPENSAHWVNTLFRQGDEMERSAIVRSLVLFPTPEDLKPIALEAGRTNSLMLYSALALKNPYPAAFYEEHEYNQIVLKSLFTGLDISHVFGLQKRANRELSRMCEDYVDERLAAGRDLPKEIWLAIGPHASQHGEELMVRFLNEDDPIHRYYAAIALARRLPEHDQLRHPMAKRLGTESETSIRAILETGLANQFSRNPR